MSRTWWAHPSAVVDDGAVVGEGTKIWHFCHVMSGARIGARCSLGQNTYVGARAVVGDGCKIQNNVSLYDEVILEDDVFVGPSAVFTNVVNPRAFVRRKDEYRQTRVGRGASIGANATVVCGHDLGPYSFVAAGAVVTKTVAPYAVCAGVPARRIGWMCRCGTSLPTETARTIGKAAGKSAGRTAGRVLACPACSDEYVLLGAGEKQTLGPAPTPAKK